MFARILILSLTLTHHIQAQDVTAFEGATILTATGEVFEGGILLIEDGKIKDVGVAANVVVPDGAQRVDASGKVIIPGLVDTHSHLGVYSRPSVPGNSDGNEATSPVQSIVRALDSLNPFDPGFRMARAGGITTGNIMPGSANVIGGQTIYVKYRGYTPEQMWIGPEEKVLGGLKMANGENPKRVYGSRRQAPGTRMKVAAMQRAEFIKAQQYQKKWQEYESKKEAGEEADAPEVDLALQPLVEVLEGKRTVHFHTHRADDILTTLRLKKEFNFDLVIQHGTEAYKIVDEIAKAEVPVSMTIVDSPGGKAEVVDFIEECGAELTRAGVKVIINTDDPITESRLFLRTAAIAHRGGMSEEETLRAVTIHAAEAMKLDHRIGSLEAGKDADFVVLSGRPFSAYSRVEQTWIDGKKEFDFADDVARYDQTGGFPLHNKESLPNPIEPVEMESIQDVADNLNDLDREVTDFVVRAGRLYPVDGDPIDDGAVHVKDGKIVAVDAFDNLNIPANVPVVTTTSATPGLIDAYSVVPLAGEYNIPADQDANEKSDPNQADVRALDGFHPSEPLLRFLLHNGVTLVHACPGRENVIAGLSGVFRTHGNTADGMAIKFPQAMIFNLGNSVKEAYDGNPSTRMGTAALLRKALSEAQSYKKKQAEANDDDEKSVDRDLKKEHLAKTLDGGIPSLFCAQRADDLLTALRISEEFSLKPVATLAAEGFLVRDILKERNVPVIVHPTMQRLGGIETYNSNFLNAAILADKDITTSICSGYEGYVPKTRVIRYEASVGMIYGLGHDGALRSITLGPAEILGIAENYGSLTAGKVADIVLYNGDPLEHVTQVTGVIVDGKLIYRRSDAPKIPLAERMQFSVPEIPCCNF